MDNKPKITAKDFFLYLAIVIGLYVSTVSFLALAFAIINKLLPLANEYTAGFDGTIRTSIATLIIFFPALLYTSHLTFQDLKAHPEKKEIWIRKWMIYLTLFVAGLTIAIDLVTLIYQFLGAEDLTLRFLLKVFLVFGSAGMAFRLCFYELKRNVAEYSKIMKLRIWLMAIVRVSAIVIGIILIGSPAFQRAKMFDDQRVSDLESIQNQIVYTQWQNKGTVPENLSVLNDPISGFTVPTDPETGASYEYSKISSSSFELCATFETVASTSTENENVPVPTLYPDPTTNQNWQHGIGNVCFTRNIDPSLYKIISPEK